MISARITPATPRESEAVRKWPSVIRNRLLKTPSITRPDISRISPSAKAGSCHSARASTCSRRFRCLTPQAAVARPAVCHKGRAECRIRHAALGRPEAASRAADAAADTAVAVHSRLAGATGDDQLGDALAERLAELQQLSAHLIDVEGMARRCAPSARRWTCRSSKRARPPVTRIVSNNPSP